MIRTIILILSFLPIVSYGITIDKHDNMVVTEEQLEKVQQIAEEICTRDIDRIFIGQLYHPGRIYGFRVFFKDEIVGTHVISRSLPIECEIDKHQATAPNSNKEMIERHVLGVDYKTGELHSMVKRLFLIGKKRVKINVPDGISYLKTKALLKAIELNSFSIQKRVQLFYAKKIELAKITDVTFDGNIVITTTTSRFSGMEYRFMALESGFQLIGVSFWRS